MREEMSRCEKELQPHLARRLSLPHTVSDRRCWGREGREGELIFTLEIEERVHS